MGNTAHSFSSLYRRWQRQCTIDTVLALLTFAPCFLAAEAASAESVSDDGEASYRYYCYQCHGYAGDARTLASNYLSPPPRDFTSTTAQQLPIERIVATILMGSEGTAMVSFASVLDEEQALGVAQYIHRAFITEDKIRARYHSPENGWPNHERYVNAYPFIEGSVSLNLPWETLTPEQRRGRRLYESACVSCHDQPASTATIDADFELRAVSYPRRHFSHRSDNADLISSASPYAMHDIAPKAVDMSELAKTGQVLYEENCAFCHASDGTGRNWIGSFLEPRPRDFTDPDFRLIHDNLALEQRIIMGIPGTSMPAWHQVLSGDEIEAIIAYIQAAFTTK